jgi:hypothetical protein
MSLRNVVVTHTDAIEYEVLHRVSVGSYLSLQCFTTVLDAQRYLFTFTVNLGKVKVGLSQVFIE